VQRRRIGAGKIGGATGEDIQGAATVTGQPLLNRLNFGVVLPGIGRGPRASHRRRIAQCSGGATARQRVLCGRPLPQSEEVPARHRRASIAPGHGATFSAPASET
jgi:hypothetical protein